MSFTDINSVEIALMYLVPGCITSFVVAQFLTGRESGSTEKLIRYFVISSFVFPITYPLLSASRSFGGIIYKYIIQLAILLIIPVIIGLLIGWMLQNDTVRKILRYFKLQTVHAIPTAWDYFLQKLTTKVLVL